MVASNRRAIRGAWALRSLSISVILLLVVAIWAVHHSLLGASQWTPDGLFYQAQVYEIQGQSETAALHSEFSSQAAIGVARGNARFGSSTWVSYAAKFYRRRWLVPLLAAAIYPAAGDRSLLDVSIAGYVVAGLLLFALLRRRFSDVISVIVVIACLLLPPVRIWAQLPLTDSWGLALETGALLAAVLAVERGGRWIAVWVLTMLALSFTRDATVVLLVATGWLVVSSRTPRAALVFAAGVVASTPALVLFGAPLVQQLAYVEQGYHVPTVVSWSAVLSHYPGVLYSLLSADAHYPDALSDPFIWYVVIALLVGSTLYLFLAGPRHDPFYILSRAAFVGAAATILLLPNYTAMRLELVFIPCVAVALAAAITRVSTLASARLMGLPEQRKPASQGE